jgi:Lipocalin-like domain
MAMNFHSARGLGNKSEGSGYRSYVVVLYLGRAQSEGAQVIRNTNMQKLLSLFAISALIAATPTTLSSSQDRTSHKRIADQFVGAWRLVSLETRGTDEKILKADSMGMFVFTRDGQASVQVMERNPPPQAAPAPEQYAHGGYEATFGTYELNEAAHTFTFHVEGALVRTLIGKDLPRSFEFSGNQLIVKSTRPDEHWKVIWEHY